MQPIDPYYACEGKNLILYRFQPAFTDFIYQCYQRSDFMQNYRLHQKLTKRQQLPEQLLKMQSLPPGMIKNIEWVICVKKSQQPIGLAALANYQPEKKTAELLVGLLGEHKEDKSKERSQTYYSHGLEATLLVIEFAFKVAQLKQLNSLVYGHNHYAQKATLKLGFHQQGMLKQQPYDDQHHLVDVYYNVLCPTDINAKANKLSRLSIRLLGRDISEASQETTTNILADDPYERLMIKLKKGQNDLK